MPSPPSLPSASLIPGPPRVPRVPWHRRLAVRLAVVLALLSMSVFAAAISLGLAAQQRHLIEESRAAGLLLAETIRSSTRDDMLRDAKSEAYEVMEGIGRLPGIEEVRIFNKDGVITFSTNREEIGCLVDLQAESCIACHASGQPIARPEDPSRTRIFTGPGGTRVLGVISAIANEPVCHREGCHVSPAEKTVLGVVDVGVSLAGIDGAVARFRRDSFGFVALAVFALAVGVYWSTRRTVERPVRRMVEATRRIAGGDLEYSVAPASDDELGQLATSFETMRASLRRTDGELRDLMNDLEQQVEDRTAALRQAQAELVQGEKLASLGKLSASIAHEINNPLAGILTFARLLVRNLEEGLPDEKARAAAVKNLKLVERETERCRDIVRNLLDFARQRPSAPREVDIVVALEESLALVGHELELKGVRLERQFAGPALVFADFGQIRQAFVNIVLNACAAMPQGGTLTVTVHREAGSRWAVAFRDTGVGIPEEILPKIFDPFFTTKEMGTGLGLSVVYGIVRQAGGELSATSRVGEGTTVTIRLPAATADRPASPEGE